MTRSKEKESKAEKHEVNKYFEEVAERMREREKTRYTGICQGCGDERGDLFLSDDPVLCGDCGLRAMMLGMGAVLIEKKPGEEM